MQGNSRRAERIVKALNQLADDLSAGTPLETSYMVRQVRVIPKPSFYPPERVRGVATSLERARKCSHSC